MKKAFIHAVTLLCAAPLAAQESGSFLDINGDVRSQAMGGVSIAQQADAFSVFGNAAAAPFSNKRVQVGAFYTPWAKEMTKDLESNNKLFGVSGYFSIGDNSSVLAGFRYFGAPKSFGMDEWGNPLGSEFKPRDFSIDLGYAYRISDNFSAALTARYVNSALGDDLKAGAVGFDLAAMYNTSLGEEEQTTLGVGLGLYNLGSKLKYDKESYAMPGRIAAGATLGTMFGDSHALTGALELGYKITGNKGFVGGLGVEYMALNTIAVRGGYHIGSEDAGSYNYGTIGAGVRIIDLIQADFSYILAGDDCPWRNTYAIALSVRF